MKTLLSGTPTFMMIVLIAIIVLMHRHGIAGPVYETTLRGRNEIPPTNSPGTGFVHITLVGNTMDLAERFSDLTGPATSAHISCCTFQGLKTLTAVPFPSFPNDATGNYSSAFDLSDPDIYDPTFLSGNGGTASGAQAALTTGLEVGGAYSEIDTAQFPRGEIRGFLGPVQTQIPEPATLVLLVSALLGLGLMLTAELRFASWLDRWRNTA